MRKHVFAVIAVFVLSIASIRPILTSGYFPMHDDTQVARVVAMGRALSEGQFPVRWVSDLGYGLGYPIFNFYGPLPYYIGGILYCLGLSGLLATKIMIASGIVLAGISMYALGFAVYGASGGILSAVLYIYAPYHALQAYVRGSIGEIWAYAFLPLVLLGIGQSRRSTHKAQAVCIGAFGLAGVILSHTILGYVTVLFLAISLVVYWVVRLIRKEFSGILFWPPAAILAAAAGLTAFFVLPASFEMRYTNVSAMVGATADFRDHFVCLSQLWSSPWGFAGSAPGCIDGMSLKLGKLHIILAACALFALLRRKKKRDIEHFVVAGLFTFFVSVFFMIAPSRLLWEKLPNMVFVQYPWRFLTYAVFGLSLIGGAISVLTEKKFFRWSIALSASVFVVGINAKWFAPQYIYQKPAESFETIEALRWSASRISDEYLPPEVRRPRDVGEIIRDTISPDVVSVEKSADTATFASYKIKAQKPLDITIYRAYFPGWEYMVNGAKVAPKIVEGLPVVSIGSGETDIVLRFADTPVRRLGNIVSMGTLAALLFWYVRNKKIIA
ncbi:hypothetical protein KKB64_03085 [Patescibacteria group bacterium]|nr:hypothetical protein [Patescibacteria group bacterium]MBU1472743.1 hypothetical protein [Patescibacteria group bacterium]MBU2460010.1 hypothetical protein [Patescibacteria group bacterium]MBU2544332.1 hypothetical protein [Patescibacteria group bacterium]